MKESNIDSILDKANFLQTGLNSTMDNDSFDKKKNFIQNLISPEETSCSKPDQKEDFSI